MIKILPMLTIDFKSNLTEKRIHLVTIALINLTLWSVPNNFLPALSRERFQGIGSLGFSPSESFSSVGWRAKGPALSTSANVNTAIPSQLETLNALDSVHCQDWSMQLMQPWSPLAASDGWNG